MAKAKTDGGDKTSKTDMVRAALDSLGMDAQPLDIQAYIKKEFNEDLKTQTISNYKFGIRKQAGQTGPGRGRGRRAVPTPTASGSAAGLQIADIEAVRKLVTRLGAAQLKQLVDVVG